MSKLLCPLLAVLLLLPAGCAKSPGGGATSPASGPQLIVTMTVAGNIDGLDPNYYYYILFNINRMTGPDGSSVGPIPVVTIGGGNGFAAGSFSHYVEYNSTQGINNNFGYYGITADLKAPIGPTQGQLIAASVSSDAHTLTFRLPLAYLATSNYTADKINNLQINFVATNIVTLPTDNILNKYYDALYTPEGALSYYNLIVRDSNGTLMPGIYSSTIPGSVNGGSVAQYVNGVPQNVTGTVNGVVTDNLRITGWSVELTAGS